MKCDARAFPRLNTCAALAARFPCRDAAAAAAHDTAAVGCRLAAGGGGEWRPAVDALLDVAARKEGGGWFYHLPALVDAAAGRCELAPDASYFSCGGSAPNTRRLCGCTPSI